MTRGEGSTRYRRPRNGGVWLVRGMAILATALLAVVLLVHGEQFQAISQGTFYLWALLVGTGALAVNLAIFLRQMADDEIDQWQALIRSGLHETAQVNVIRLRIHIPSGAQPEAGASAFVHPPNMRSPAPAHAQLRQQNSAALL